MSILFYDSFDTNTNSLYIQSADGNGNWYWNTALGQLEVSSGNQTLMLKKDITLTDFVVETTVKAMADGGIAFRYQNNSNYYLLAFRDSSTNVTSGGANNIQFYRRNNGPFESFAGVNTPEFARNVEHIIRLEVTGNIFKVYLDNVLKLTSTDNLFTKGGLLGLRNSSSTGPGIYTNFTIMDSIKSKFLVKDGNEIKSISSNNWYTIGTYPLTEDMFKNNGLDSVYTITDTLLRQLNNDKPTILLWTDNTIDTRNFKMTAIPTARIVFPKTDVPLASIENIDQISIASSIGGVGNLRIITSTDGGITWKTFKDNSWQIINHNDINLVLSQGMTSDLVNSLLSTNWKDLINNGNKIRFAYAFSINTSTDTVQIDKVQMTVDMRGIWDLCIPGTDYKYSYVNSDTMSFKLFSNGDYKINY